MSFHRMERFLFMDLFFGERGILLYATKTVSGKTMGGSLVNIEEFKVNL